MLVTQLLKTGKDNAIPGWELCQILDVTQRVLGKMIENERRAGSPICANSGAPWGFYLAANRSEMEDYCASLRKRASEIFKTRRACMKSKEKLPE